MPEKLKQKSSKDIGSRGRIFIKALKQRAAVFRSIGEYDKGIIDIKKAISVSRIESPHSPEELLLTIDLADLFARGKGSYKYAATLIKKNLPKIQRGENIYLHAQSLEALGIIAFYQCKYFESLRYLLNALRTYKRLKVRRNIASIAGNIGLVYREQGDLSRALRYYRIYMTLSKSARNKIGMMKASGLIGVVYRIRGELNKALKYQHFSLMLSRDIGNAEVLITALNNVGNIYYSKGDLNTALKYYSESLTLSKKLRNQRSIGFAYSNIGAICYDKGDFEMALKYVSQFHKISWGIGFNRGVAVACSQTALILIERGKFDSARKHLRKAEKTFKELGSKLDLAEVYANISSMHLRQAHFKKAVEYARKGLLIARNIGAREYEIDALRELGKAQFYLVHETRRAKPNVKFKKMMKEAALHLKQSASLARKRHLSFKRAISLYELAMVCQRMEHQRSTITSLKVHNYLREAKRIFEKANAAIWIQRAKKAMRDDRHGRM